MRRERLNASCLALCLLTASCATVRPDSRPAAEPRDACVALQTVGFDEIVERAVQRGLVRRVAAGVSMDSSRLAPGRLYAQAAAAVWLWQLTEQAIEAGVPQRALVIVAGCTEAVATIWEMVRRRKPTCEKHYAACIDKLGWTPGNHWNQSVCNDCLNMCRNGDWPYKNTKGDDCPGADN